MRFRVLIADDSPQTIAKRGHTDLREIEVTDSFHRPSIAEMEWGLRRTGSLRDGECVVLVERIDRLWEAMR